jgi:hypothetical protein
MVSCLDLPQFPHALGGTASRSEPTVIYVNLAALSVSPQKQAYQQRKDKLLPTSGIKSFRLRS